MIDSIEPRRSALAWAAFAFVSAFVVVYAIAFGLTVGVIGVVNLLRGGRWR